METLLPPSSTAEASSEQLPGSALCESAGQQSMDSPPSTISQEEASSSGSDHGLRPPINKVATLGDDFYHPIKIEDNEDGQNSFVPSKRPKRKRWPDEMDNIISDADTLSDCLNLYFRLQNKFFKFEKRVGEESKESKQQIKDLKQQIENQKQQIENLKQQIKDLEQENHEIESILIKETTAA